MTHPIITAASDVADALKAAHGVEPTFMSIAEKEAALVALAEVRSGLDALAAEAAAATPRESA